MIVHKMKERNGREAVTQCGDVIRVDRPDSERVSIWEDTTCGRCLAQIRQRREALP